MIELRKLSVFELSITFARLMGDNKIRHYRIPAAGILMHRFTGMTAEDLVKDHIKFHEKDESEVVFLPQKVGTPFFQKSYDSDSPALPVKDVSNIILKNYPEIKFSLEQRKMTSVLHQYNEDPTPIRSRFLSPITTLVNRGICKINQLLRDYQFKDLDLVNMDRMEYLNLEYFQIPLLPMYGMMRQVALCSYLTIAFEEDDIQEATTSLVSDLKTLNDKGLIMGSLSMPSMMLLADTVGSGKVMCALFCFLFVDRSKLMKQLNIKSNKDIASTPLSLIGVKNEVLEGDINYLNGIDPKSKYEIESIDVAVFGTSEGSRQAHIDNYNETAEKVNSIAKKAKERLSGVTVENSRSSTIHTGSATAVAVDVDLVDKNGKKTTVGQLYAENENRQFNQDRKKSD